mmetsp:Transcript_4173/g.7077  ORF Transcript_4173/g.7077 Transcript_4173/m.7077 type:complete len:82 (+) Transcript_4173:195-440(+)
MEALIGTLRDNQKFRREVSSELEMASKKSRESAQRIKEFQELSNLPATLKSEHQEQSKAFSESNKVQLQRLMDVAQKIKQK